MRGLLPCGSHGGVHATDDVNRKILRGEPVEELVVASSPGASALPAGYRKLACDVKRALASGGVLLLAITAANTASAQTNSTEDSSQLETVVVTGSHIRRTDSETSSPVQVLTAADLHQSGYTNVQEVLKNLTANGQGTLSQSFSGAFASGASGVALRGLNVGNTLILIDGHRMAPYPIGDDGERSFVDISNIPFDSIERIEVLKDGASAIYGSDAIAGVVNVILKKTYNGANITADAGTSAHADGTTGHLAGTYGSGDLASDGHNFYVSGEFRKQQQITYADRGGIFTQTDFTGTGGLNLTPGVPTAINPLPYTATGYVVDPSTSQIAGFMPGCNATTFAAGQCSYRNTWSQIQPATENYNFVGKYTQDFDKGWELGLQGTYFEGKSQQVGGPVGSFTGGYQGVTAGPGVAPTLLTPLGPTTIPSTNPSFPAGTGLSVANLYAAFLNVGPTVTDTDAKSYRAIADLDGKIGSWDTNFSAGFTETSLYITYNGEVQPGLLQTALDSTTAPFLVGEPNSAAVNNSVAPQLSTTDTSKLAFAHAGATGSVAELQGGPLSLAFGADYYERQQSTLAPGAVANGLLNSLSNAFAVGSQQVGAGYVEMVAPIVKQFEVDAAARYDHYNLSGGKASPKIGFKFTPVPEFAIRGTASKGFRAPGPAENGTAGLTFFAGQYQDPVLCPHPTNPTQAGNFVGQCAVNIAGFQTTNQDLKPETSKSYTFGFIFEPVKDFSATVDLYYIGIDNQIISGGPQTFVRSTNLTPIPQYLANGQTQLVAPPVGPVAYFTTGYINANTTNTDGIEFGIDYHHMFDSGWKYESKLDWTYINEYEINVGGVNYQLAGTHGPSYYSGDTGNPKSRVNWSNTVKLGSWSVTGTLNYISSFSVLDPALTAFEGIPGDTCLNSLSNQGGAAGRDYQNVLNSGQVPSATSCKVDHFTTFDLYSQYDFGNHFSLHGSITNLFNEKAPLDWATYAGAGVPWNPSYHLQGAIGTFFSLGATYTF